MSSEEPLDCCAMFEPQASYDTRLADGGVSTKCKERPVGTVCYAFDDDYVWLLSFLRPGYARAQCPEGQVDMLYKNESTTGANGSIYLHRHGTDLVKTLRPCPGQSALDPRACDADVSIAVLDDAGLTFKPVDRRQFDAAEDSGAPTHEEEEGNAPAGADASDPTAGQGFAAAPNDGCSIHAVSTGRSAAWLAICAAALWLRRRAGRTSA